MTPTKASLELLLLNIREDLENLLADEGIEAEELEDIVASINEELGIIEEALIDNDPDPDDSEPDDD